VAARLLIVDAALRDGVAPEQVQQRVLNDGSQHAVYKRYFTAEQLARELGSGAVLYGGQWFVAVMA
jgi:demethylmenaquinone methyltransferase/2-methoxy-6-polyprenyl-1,4-benzoquinol methylase